jgi:superkiller protein 3
MPDGSFIGDAVKVTLSTTRGSLAIVFTENQGDFDFSELTPGMYIVEVEGDKQKFDVVTENVQVFRGAPSIVTITLKPQKGSYQRGNGGREVSVTELSQRIPSRANKEFEKATEAGSLGRTDEAIAHLRKAIDVFPDFVRAHNDLGTYLLAQGKLQEAADEFKRAVSIDDKAFNPKLNLGIVLVHQQRFAEANEILSKALSLEPNSPSAHLYSGLSFLGGENLDAAESELKIAYNSGGPKFAVALFHLGQLYMNRRQHDSALKAFEAYLATVPNANNADQVRRLISLLRP